MAPRITPDQAATLALKGLAYLVNSEDALDRFLHVSGAGWNSLQERADEPEFLAAILDFLLSNEVLLVDFLGDSKIDVRAVHMARHVLGGE
jgi:Protein of unknown function (DUF3572)